MLPHLTDPRPWQPLDDAELGVLAPFFARQGSGRPIFDIRARLDAILWAACHDGPWKDLPPDMGPADTASRQFRRWAHAGVWSRLLTAVADPAAPPALRRLEHWICRAYRRALRILKIAGIVLARRLGLHSALNAPASMLPDPDLSKILMPLVQAKVAAMQGRCDLGMIPILRMAMAIHKLVGGRTRIPRWLAPP